MVSAPARHGPFDTTIDGDLVRRFGAATGETAAGVLSGDTVPAALLTCRIFEAQTLAREAVVSDGVRLAAGGGVHGEHDLVLHRPIVPGEPLQTWVELHGTRPAGANALVVVRYRTHDAVGALVAEQWWTTVYLGTTCERSGPPVPHHRFPEAARDRPLGTLTVTVDPDMARRYAEVSGDWSAHHFEVDAARASGADRPFLHGLCTMTLCARAIATVAADGDHRRIRRVAVRFAAPLPLRERLVIDVFDAGELGFAFEATCGDIKVISHGRAQLRPPGS